MTESLARLLDALAGTRAELLAALEGAPDAMFAPRRGLDESGERRSLGDLLWDAGVLDDWTRLALDQALDGRPVAARLPRARPAYLDSPELLRAWIDQTRGALLARARRLGEADLAASVVTRDGARTSPRQLLEALILAERAGASRVRAWLGSPGPTA